MSQKRLLLSPAAAWVAAALGAWLAGASCRTVQVQGLTPAAAGGAPEAEPGVPPPAVRVGILVDIERVSIGADSGLEARVRVRGQSGVRVVTTPRLSFRGGALPGTIAVSEIPSEVELVSLRPVVDGELLRVEAAAYRGLLEVRPGAPGKLTVVNRVNLEDYVRGVVPNELSPQAFPEIEALEAQAVAARTYAMAHLGEYSARGFDVCATQSCQVYRGRDSEDPLSDEAVASTRGQIATWRGKPINAYYTSTCGGHTEEGSLIFDDAAPYLRGVACLPERSARQTLRTALAPRRDLAAAPEAARNVGLLEALGVLAPEDSAGGRLSGIAGDAELRAWTERLKAALHRGECQSHVGGALARRATFARHLVASVCWTERGERLLGPGDAEYLLQAEDAGELDGGGERQAVALLVREGILSPGADNSLRPNAALSRAEVVALMAGVALKAGAPSLFDGELVSVAEGVLRVARGETVVSHPLEPALHLVRDLEGVHAAAGELALTVGDRVVYVLRDGRVAYLEAEQSRRGAAADRSSRYFSWDVRLTPNEVAQAVARYGSVGAVRDLVPRRLGVSGRVVELAVVGSAGELSLTGLKVRWGLGLRENLFVISRERGPNGVERFVLTGKGWGHGVGLCQVGAYGMARAGADHEQILKHYYTGIALSSLPN